MDTDEVAGSTDFPAGVVHSSEMGCSVDSADRTSEELDAVKHVCSVATADVASVMFTHNVLLESLTSSSNAVNVALFDGLGVGDLL